MDIIFNGKQSGEELVSSIQNVLRLFKERYHIPEFREIHLVVTLLDETGNDVELVDNQNATVYRTFEVYQEKSELRGQKSSKKHPKLKLIVDNTHH